jgi:hypothetical protein
VETPLPHPAAPTELKQKFAELLKAINQQSTELSSGSNVYREFWEAPSRFWQPKVRQLTEDEMDSIMVRGVLHLFVILIIFSRAAAPHHIRIFLYQKPCALE